MRSTARLCVALVSLWLAGCAGTYLAKPAQDKNHPGRITAASVVWVDTSSLPISISKSAAGYGYTPPKPTVTEKDRSEARARVAAVLSAYRQKAPELLMKGLASEGVHQGDETRITVRPVSTSINGDNGAVHVAVEVAVRHADASSDWKIVPVTQNMLDGAYWNVFRKPGIGQEVDVDLDKLVVSFSDAVVREMRMAGWFR
ncbi:MAG: hypothetical protein HS128_14310 [Ideonella sp.]|nr:hypothetical protein [Ideonella sp.]MCC7459256.1 hypothetical protein [Nitrospira sp.]